MRTRLVTFLAALLFVAVAAYGQTVTGSISGRVLDGSGLPVPNAHVELINEETHVQTGAITDNPGDFLFVSTEPGRYTVTVQMDGFKKYTLSNLNLTPNDRLAVGNLTLEVGTVVENVTVKAEGAVVETENSDRTAVITSDQMNMLMERDRNPLTLLNTIPGTVGSDTNNFQNRSLPNFNGVPNTFGAVMGDGQNSGALSNPQYFAAAINMDAIAEMKVVVNNYKAEYGRNGSAVVTIVTKSGTSQFHGGAYDYLRNESMNANDFFNNRLGLPRAIYRYNTIGGTFGGPVEIPGKFTRLKDKLFFFFSEDHVTSAAPQALTTLTVPTALERTGNFSQSVNPNGSAIIVKDPNTNTAFPGNLIPASRLDASGINLLKLFPLPNYTNRTVSLGNYNYLFQDSNNNPVHQEVLRLDYNVTDKFRMYYRGATDFIPQNGYNADGQISQNWPLVKLHSIWSNPSMVYHLSYSANATTFFEGSAGWAATRDRDVAASASDVAAVQRGAAGINIPQLYPHNNPLNLVPNTAFSGITNAANITFRGDFPGDYYGPRVTINGSATKIAGTHTLKAGIYEEILHYYRQDTVNFNGTMTFSNDANNPYNTGYAYSNAALGTFTSYSEVSNRITNYMKANDFDFYLQDTWKATPRLTIDIGSRFTYFTPYHQGNNIAANFLTGSYDPKSVVTLYQPVLNSAGARVALNPLNGQLAPATLIGAIVPGAGNARNGMVSQTDAGQPSGFLNNWGLQPGPRAGFAYALTRDNKTAVRGGFGITYFGFASGGTSTPMVDNVATTPTIYYGTFNTFNPGAGVLFPTSVSSFNENIKGPAVYNYSVSVQRDLGFGSVLEVAYVAALGRNLSQTQQLNTLPYGERFLASAYDATTKKPLPDNFLKPYLGYVNVSTTRTTNSHYESLQVRFNRRFTSRLQYGVSYTWAKAMGYTGTYPTYLDNKLNYGETNLDRTHTLVANWLYDLPNPGNRVHFAPAKVVLNGWQLSGIASFISGAPVGITSFSLSSGQDLVGGGDWSRPLVIANPVLPRDQRTFDHYFNSASLALPGLGNYGNAPVDLFRGPGRNWFDMSLFKNFNLREHLRLQLRWEVYNVFNHVNFYSVNTSLQFNAAGQQINNALGQLTGDITPRQMQIAARLSF